jgi:thiol-disulfide isomerase/thioredoxin
MGRPGCRWLLARWVVAAAAGALFGGAAWAQFQRLPWPAGQATPALDLIDLQGQRWRTDALKGRAVVINFWASWCQPCKEELPSLQTLHEVSAGQPVVIAINVREPLARATRYVQAAGLSLPVVSDPQGDLARRWGVTVYPTTVLIGADGRARWRVIGDLDWTGAESVPWLAALAPSRP